ncbi:TetR/AcrR family transcriptional regulator [Phyllobacterium chamaecytisi]|uniref:TetR/AcrR family transcriptional regulator n=1 Tax=Phyllobacterium chamaecytisi TaxID=2876082 RepID=UPI001CCA5F40|nr:TetR family transcriptional regulator C-terminal domain-containing protein [Phyllobacterium sp. KW56]MBZ9605568.1 TetR family transcriptional regulator C-terminal domain-containing protein [Phyllobacterium sp. KW56]
MARSFARMPEAERRHQLIEATLDCIFEYGIQGTTVRSVAAHAGVTNGLIRHHFENKANLIAAAYQQVMLVITSSAYQALATAQGSPRERLHNFVEATLKGQAAEYRMLALWGTFVGQSRVDPLIGSVRDESYASLRSATEPLIAQVMRDAGKSASSVETSDLTIAILAIIDGLWIESCLSDEGPQVDRLVNLGIRSIARLLDLPPK